jgi:hypothetical protein
MMSIPDSHHTYYIPPEYTNTARYDRIDINIDTNHAGNTVWDRYPTPNSRRDPSSLNINAG